MYHADLASEQGGNLTTDIAIQNAGEEDVELPATSKVVIGVNKVLPGATEEKHEAEKEQQLLGIQHNKKTVLDIRIDKRNQPILVPTHTFFQQFANQ